MPHQDFGSRRAHVQQRSTDEDTAGACDRPFAQRYYILMADGRGVYQPIDLESLGEEQIADISRRILQAAKLTGWQVRAPAAILRVPPAAHAVSCSFSTGPELHASVSGRRGYLPIMSMSHVHGSPGLCRAKGRWKGRYPLRV